MTSHWAPEQYLTARQLNAFLPRAVIKQIREPRDSTTTMVPDGELRVTLPTGQWAITIYIVIERPTGAGTGIRTRWFFPSGVTTTTLRYARGTVSAQSDPDDTLARMGAHFLTTAVQYGSEVFTNQVWTAVMEHSIVTLPAGGEIGLAWAQQTFSSDENYVAPGSYLIAEPVDLF
ncbi:hypothetical protein [Glycomyces tarimensis]